MAMIGRHDGVFDARCGKLTDRARQVNLSRNPLPDGPGT